MKINISNWVSGGVFSQYNKKNKLKPVAFFSSKYITTKYNYEIYNKKLFIIIKVLEEWRSEL